MKNFAWFLGLSTLSAAALASPPDNSPLVVLKKSYPGLRLEVYVPKDGPVSRMVPIFEKAGGKLSQNDDGKIYKIEGTSLDDDAAWIDLLDKPEVVNPDLAGGPQRPAARQHLLSLPLDEGDVTEFVATTAITLVKFRGKFAQKFFEAMPLAGIKPGQFDQQDRPTAYQVKGFSCEVFRGETSCQIIVDLPN